MWVLLEPSGRLWIVLLSADVCGVPHRSCVGGGRERIARNVERESVRMRETWRVSESENVMENECERENVRVSI